ncbi:aminotransferase class IV [Limisalsivibrio acetivorans]|uniref:aminotransferase class IV n=1 Tax=Limisalsivibrio acetivorans TaxID=1304888 RepID=UPI0003B4313D|nr:aminotransferase class IV [Limisalsivibrio acetivorans]
MKIYNNGRITDDIIETSVKSPHFRSGNGFFETICYNGNEICHLKKHIDRLSTSLADFGMDKPDFDAEKGIMDVIIANNLKDKVCRVNIFAVESPYGTDMIITAEEYAGSPDVFKLNIHDKFQISTMNRYKSTSWMHHQNARKRALDGGYDDALLVDEHNRVFETATASIVFKKEGRFITTTSENRLAGISLELLKELRPVEEKEITLRDFMGMQNCYVLNSMIGIKPVESISVFNFEVDSESVEYIADIILQR